MAFTMVSSFRIDAMIATLRGLPAAQSRR